MRSLALFLILSLPLQLLGDKGHALNHCKLRVGKLLELEASHWERIRHIPLPSLRRLLGFLEARDLDVPFTVAQYAPAVSVDVSTASLDLRLARLASLLAKGPQRGEFVLQRGRGAQGWDAFREYGREVDEVVEELLKMFSLFGRAPITLEGYRSKQEGLQRSLREYFRPLMHHGLAAGVLGETAPRSYTFILPPPTGLTRGERLAAKLREYGVPLALWQGALEFKEYVVDHLLKAFGHWGVSTPFMGPEYAEYHGMSLGGAYQEIKLARRVGILIRVQGMRGHYIFVGQEGASNPVDTLPALLEEKGVAPEVWERAGLLGHYTRFHLIQALRACEGLTCSRLEYREATGVDVWAEGSEMRKAFFAGITETGRGGEDWKYRKAPGPVGWDLLGEYGPGAKLVEEHLRQAFDGFQWDRFSRRDFLDERNVSVSTADYVLNTGVLVRILRRESRVSGYVFILSPPGKKARAEVVAPKGGGQDQALGGDDDLPLEMPETSREILEREGPRFFEKLRAAGIPRDLWERAELIVPFVLKKLMKIVKEGRAQEAFEAHEAHMVTPFFLGLVKRAEKKGHFVLARERGLGGWDFFGEWGDPDLTYRVREGLEYFEGRLFTPTEYEVYVKSFVADPYAPFQMDIWVAQLAGLVGKRDGGYIGLDL